MSVFNKIISFFCGDNIDKIRIRGSTVMRNNQVHKLHKEIIDQLGDLATVVSRSYVYGKIKDATGLSVRHISKIINHTKAVDVR